MTPEEIEIRKNFGIKDQDILQIPALALWELCRQFNVLIDNTMFPTYLGDFFYRFYCIRVEELAKIKRRKKLGIMIQCEICGLSVPSDTISNVTTSICETTSGVCYDLETGGINVCKECIQALKGGFGDVIFKLREAQKEKYNYTGTYREDEGV